jgi:hypothetical protein
VLDMAWSMAGCNVSKHVQWALHNLFAPLSYTFVDRHSMFSTVQTVSQYHHPV